MRDVNESDRSDLFVPWDSHTVDVMRFETKDLGG